MKILALILARGGSKGLPKKNIKNFNGKPLICWTIAQAINSKSFDQVVVSTDSEEIATVSLEHGAKVPFIRPEKLSQDESKSIDAVIHCIDFYKQRNIFYDAICLLEPTSPLRTPKQLNKIVESFINKKHKYDSLITIGKVREPIELHKLVKGEELLSVRNDNVHHSPRRQDTKEIFFPYGVAYITKTQTILEEKTLYSSRSTYFKIDQNQCFEIDDKLDFDINEFLFKEYYYNKQ